MLTLSKIYAVKTKRPLVKWFAKAKANKFSPLVFTLSIADRNHHPPLDRSSAAALPAYRQAGVHRSVPKGSLWDNSMHQQSVNLQIYLIFSVVGANSLLIYLPLFLKRVTGQKSKISNLKYQIPNIKYQSPRSTKNLQRASCAAR